MRAARIEAVELRRPNLRTPFPPQFASRLAGQTVVDVARRAKYLLAPLASGETLLMHLGMSGSFRIDAAPAAPAPPVDPGPHDHVVFHLSSGAVVTFNDPRRFGVMDLLTPGAAADHPVLSRLGPEPLSDDFDAAALARACRGRTTSLKAALLDQRVVAGLGNIYAVEALHRARLSPSRRASTIATPGGAPRDSAVALTRAIKQVLEEAIARAAGVRYRTGRFRVYDRAGDPCRRTGCPGVIRRRVHAGRSTYFCPVCQK